MLNQILVATWDKWNCVSRPWNHKCFLYSLKLNNLQIIIRNIPVAGFTYFSNIFRHECLWTMPSLQRTGTRERWDLDLFCFDEKVFDRKCLQISRVMFWLMTRISCHRSLLNSTFLTLLIRKWLDLAPLFLDWRVWSQECWMMCSWTTSPATLATLTPDTVTRPVSSPSPALPAPVRIPLHLTPLS